MRFIVGYEFDHDDIKELKSFDNYSDAFLYLLDRCKEDFQKLNRMPTALKLWVDGEKTKEYLKLVVE